MAFSGRERQAAKAQEDPRPEKARVKRDPSWWVELRVFFLEELGKKDGNYPLVNVYITMENHHF